MNLRAELALSLAAHGEPPPGLFFQPADSSRLQGCLASLMREGRSLAMSSRSEAALGHYSELLVHQLRRAATCPVEIYFPASTQAMVARFDELLAGMTVQEAMSEAGPAAAGRIWLVHDAGALAEHELQLLARLVSHFPGAGVRVVLLLGPGLRGRRAFDSLGRRFLRWDIELPTPAQAQAMLAQARSDGCEHLVAELLRHVQPLRPAVPLAPPPTVTLDALPAVAAPAPAAEPTRRRQARRPWIRRLALCSAALAVLAGAWLWQPPLQTGLPWLGQLPQPLLRTQTPTDAPAPGPRTTTPQRT